MKIIVQVSDKRSMMLDVKSSDVIEDLKSKIEEEEGIPIDQQRLFFYLNQLEDYYSLDHYNVKETSILHLFLKPQDGILMTIIVAEQNNHYEICINSSETILYLKYLCYTLSGLQVNFQSLCFGKNILNNYCTLESYGIGPGTILHLFHLSKIC